METIAPAASLMPDWASRIAASRIVVGLASGTVVDLASGIVVSLASGIVVSLASGMVSSAIVASTIATAAGESSDSASAIEVGTRGGSHAPRTIRRVHQRTA